MVAKRNGELNEFTIEIGHSQLDEDLHALSVLKEKRLPRFHRPVTRMEMREKWMGKMRDRIMGVPVEARAILGRKKMSLHEFASLGAGNVIMVDRYVNDAIDVEIHRKTKFRGKMGVFKGSKAVRVDEVVQ